VRKALPFGVERRDHPRRFDDPSNVPRPRSAGRGRHLSTETEEESPLRLLGRRLVQPQFIGVGDGVGPRDEEVDVVEIDVAESRPSRDDPRGCSGDSIRPIRPGYSVMDDRKGFWVQEGEKGGFRSEGHKGSFPFFAVEVGGGSELRVVAVPVLYWWEVHPDGELFELEDGPAWREARIVDLGGREMKRGGCERQDSDVVEGKTVVETREEGRVLYR